MGMIFCFSPLRPNIDSEIHDPGLISCGSGWEGGRRGDAEFIFRSRSMRTTCHARPDAIVTGKKSSREQKRGEERERMTEEEEEVERRKYTRYMRRCFGTDGCDKQ